MTDLKDRVRQFWNDTPLFAGESASAPGEANYFKEHEAVYLRDVFQGRVPDRFFPFPAGAKVLEVGCGPGFWTRQLAARDYDVTAIDLAPSAVDLARKGLALAGLNARVEIGDAEAVPFEAASFDAVVSHGVIHHTPDTQACLREFARVLKPGGAAVVSVYYHNFVLRSPALTKIAGTILSPLVGLKGRGRESLLSSGDANEIVRLYDGADNPIGKSYARGQFLRMIEAAGLKAAASWRFYFPLRAFGPLGQALAPFRGGLSDAFGLMLVVQAIKPAPAA
jgi:SAM-dependent methyltransferase